MMMCSSCRGSESYIDLLCVSIQKTIDTHFAAPAKGHLHKELYNEAPAKCSHARAYHHHTSPPLSLSPILTSELAELHIDCVTQTAETSPLIIASITSVKILFPHSFHLFLLIDHTPSKIFLI